MSETDGREPSRFEQRPDDVSSTGVPGPGSEHEGFVLALALLVAVLGLVVTLGWVVFHRLTGG